MPDFEVKYSVQSEIFKEKLWSTFDELNRKAAAHKWNSSDASVETGLTIILIHKPEIKSGDHDPTFQLLKTKLAVITLFPDLNLIENVNEKMAFVRDSTLEALRIIQKESPSNFIDTFYPQFQDFFEKYYDLDGGEPTLSPKDLQKLHFDFEGRSRDVVSMAMKDNRLKTLPKLEKRKEFENLEFFLQSLLDKLNKADSAGLIARMFVEGHKTIKSELPLKLPPSEIQMKFMTAVIAFVRDIVLRETVGITKVEFLQNQHSYSLKMFMQFLDHWTETRIHVSALPPSSWLMKLVGKRNYAMYFESI